MKSLGAIVNLAANHWQTYWPDEADWLKREGLWQKELETVAQLVLLRAATLSLSGETAESALHQALQDYVFKGPLSSGKPGE